jgi:hypothetical protein
MVSSSFHLAISRNRHFDITDCRKLKSMGLEQLLVAKRSYKISLISF